VDGASSSNDAARLGTAVHAALEAVYRPLCDDCLLGQPAPYLDAWKAAWAASGLVGAELYAEGLAMVRPHASDKLLRELPIVQALEATFELPLPGGHTLVGTIDRIDATPEGLLVIDYKSNRAIYTRDDVDGSLQLALYEAGAAALYPAEECGPVRGSCYVMLRHGSLVQHRDPAAVLTPAAALEYAAHMGGVIEADTRFYPKLNHHCGWCSFRGACEEYRAALESTELQPIDVRDIDAVAAERERVAAIAKLAEERKAELDRRLKADVAELGALTAGGYRYGFSNHTRASYPVAAVLENLRAMGVATEGATMSRAEVRALLAGLPEERAGAALLALDEHQQTQAYPVFSARKVRK